MRKFEVISSIGGHGFKVGTIAQEVYQSKGQDYLDDDCFEFVAKHARFVYAEADFYGRTLRQILEVDVDCVEII